MTLALDGGAFLAEKAYPEAITMNKLIGLAILAAVSALGVACGGDQPKPVDPTSTMSTTTTTTTPVPSTTSTTSTTTTTTDKKP